MLIYDAEMLEDDGGQSLTDAQNRIREEEAPGEEESRRCGLCKRLEDPKRGYQTSAGWICGSCASYFADEAQR